jgi:hypothetical protein
MGFRDKSLIMQTYFVMKVKTIATTNRLLLKTHELKPRCSKNAAVARQLQWGISSLDSTRFGTKTFFSENEVVCNWAQEPTL